MNTEKLKEALLELQIQKLSIDQAIKSLQAIIVSFNGTEVTPRKVGAVPSFVEATESILASRGKPMHIKELVFEINKLRGAESTRNSVQAGLSRHMNEGSDSRIVKPGPGMFALSEWSQEVKDQWAEIVNE